MFVHDFVAVPVPVDETVRRFTAELPTPNLAALINRHRDGDEVVDEHGGPVIGGWEICDRLDHTKSVGCTAVAN